MHPISRKTWPHSYQLLWADFCSDFGHSLNHVRVLSRRMLGCMNQNCVNCVKKKNNFKSLNTDYFLIHSYKALKCFFSSVTHMFLRSTNRITCKSRDLLLLCPLKNFSMTELNLGKSYLSDLHEHQREETKLNGLEPFFFFPFHSFL